MIFIDSIKIDNSWKKILFDEFQKDYFLEIKKKLINDINNWKVIYPKWSDIFNAFNQTSFDNVKVVILWQDPYHWEWESHWLCFSVQDWIKIPPSLRNIFKELQSDIEGFVVPNSWNLEYWAKQWVLLLNSSLTVIKDNPNSHKDIWRQFFTDTMIKKLSLEKKWLVFLLRWAYAQTKIPLIDQAKHLILQTTHPSPFSAHKGFLWSKHFSKTNDYLVSQGIRPIDRYLS